jgi:hypothetical protein
VDRSQSRAGSSLLCYLPWLSCTAQLLDGRVDHRRALGVWGGLDPNQRADVARETGLPVPTVLPMRGFRARYAKHGCRCRACRYANTTYISERRRKASAA